MARFPSHRRHVRDGRSAIPPCCKPGGLRWPRPERPWLQSARHRGAHAPNPRSILGSLNQGHPGVRRSQSLLAAGPLAPAFSRRHSARRRRPARCLQRQRGRGASPAAGQVCGEESGRHSRCRREISGNAISQRRPPRAPAGSPGALRPPPAGPPALAAPQSGRSSSEGRSDRIRHYGRSLSKAVCYRKLFLSLA
jgi:hypothetical protein